MYISPAVLARSEEDAKKKLFHPGVRQAAERFHIDVLDGTMFGASCWADPNIIGEWNDLPEIEIHLMVQNPVLHVVSWKTAVPTLKNVIIHAEISRPLQKVCSQIKLMQLGVSLAVNPETMIENLGQYEKHIDELLVMGVHPGKSAQSFLGEPILAKIRRAHALHPALPIAVDGGVNTKVIRPLAEAGASRFIAANAIWSKENPREALDELSRCAIISA